MLPIGKLIGFAIAASTAYTQPLTVDLNGAWSAVKAGNLEASPFAAKVPGQIHLDLLANGLIDDPFNASNDQALRWVALSDWTYSRTFNASAEFIDKRNVQLIANGLDTIADVSINGKLVLAADNMFQRYRIGVKNILRTGENSIVVAFKSKVIEANKTAGACDTTTSQICPYRIDNAVQHGR